MEIVTIKDIAKMCSVGVSTVSRAMKNHPDINEETRKKIMDMIEEYHYVPNNSARNLKRSDSRAIAVLIKGISNPFFCKMIKVFEKEIQKEKYTFVIQHVDENQDEVEVAIQLEKEKRLNGIVFLGGHFLHTEEKLKQIPIPFVLSTTGLLVSNRSYPAVCVDDIRESCRIVSYLIEKGHKRIAIITSPKEDESIGRLRLAGYEKALNSHGLPYDEELILHMKDEMESYSLENGYEVTKELLASGKEFSAIFATSDSIAIGACKAIFDNGKSVPQDYSVAGFDGINMAAFYNPSITTIRQPVEQMAEATIRILFDLINQKESTRRRVFEGELLEGQSVQNVYGALQSKKYS